jgi:hypothetical protein
MITSTCKCKIKDRFFLEGNVDVLALLPWRKEVGVN